MKTKKEIRIENKKYEEFSKDYGEDFDFKNARLLNIIRRMQSDLSGISTPHYTLSDRHLEIVLVDLRKQLTDLLDDYEHKKSSFILDNYEHRKIKL